MAAVFPPRSGDDAKKHVSGKAKQALNVILQNIEFLQIGFAASALSAFRDAAPEGHLGFEETAKVLSTLQLSSFVEGGSDTGLPLGAGEEWHRLWRLWRKEETETVDEQSFLWLAWRGHRFCDHRFVKDIAWPLFQTLDLDKDHQFTTQDLNATLTEGGGLGSMSSKEAHKAIDLYQLLTYHAPKDEVGKWKEDAALSFPSFLAWICDAQDTAAIHKASSKGPIECAVRFERGVVFLRPLDVGACVDPKNEQEFDKLLGQSPQEMALEASLQALQEARVAKEAAEAASQAVAELARSQSGTPVETPTATVEASFNMPRAPLVQSMIEEAPLAEAPQKTVQVPQMHRAPVEEGIIEEAPLMEPITRVAGPALTPKPLKIQMSVTDISCRSCGHLVKSDSNFCRHCGAPVKGKRSSKALRVNTKAMRTEEENSSTVVCNPRLPCALDADTESLVQMVETPNTVRIGSVEMEDWEEPFCGTCGTKYLQNANFCCNCGKKRERESRPSSPRTPKEKTAKPEEPSKTPASTGAKRAPEASVPKKVSVNGQGKGAAPLSTGIDTGKTMVSEQSTLQKPGPAVQPAAPAAPAATAAVATAAQPERAAPELEDDMESYWEEEEEEEGDFEEDPEVEPSKTEVTGAKKSPRR